MSGRETAVEQEEPEPPREPTEREKMAAALFGGVTSAAPQKSTSRLGGGRLSTSRGAVVQRSEAPLEAVKSSSAPSVDETLLDLMGGSSEPAPISSSANGEQELMGLFSSPAPAPVENSLQGAFNSLGLGGGSGSMLPDPRRVSLHGPMWSGDMHPGSGRCPHDQSRCSQSQCSYSHGRGPCSE